MKVKTMQAGGYLTYQPLPIIPLDAPAMPQTQSAEQPKSKEQGYIDDDIVKQLLGKGITVDVMQYSNMINNASQTYAGLSDLERNSYKGQQLRSVLKGDLGMLNGLIRSKEFFDNAVTTAKSNKALDELAVNQYGMYVKDKDGKIKNVGFGEYNKNKDSYYALTNAELAEEREFNRDLIGNSSVFSALNFGKGMDLVKDEIYKVLSHVGKHETKTMSGQFQLSSAEASELEDAAKQGMFKIKSGESLSTNQPHLEKAKQTMWLNLSENSKNVLRARAASLADSPDKIEQTAMTMAASLLDPAEEISKSVTYDTSYSKGKGGSDGGAKGLDDVGPNQMAFMGRLNEINLSQIGDYGVTLQTVGHALPSSSYLGKDNSITTLRSAPKLWDLAKVKQAFTMDGSPINIDETVITGGAYYAEVLVKPDGNGNTVVDEEGTRRLADYQNELASIPAPHRSTLKISELQQKYGINSLNLKKMVVVEAASYDPKLWGSRDSKYFSKADDYTEELVEGALEKAHGKRSYMLDNPIQKHLVFIPANDEASARFADNEKAKVSKAVHDIGAGFNSGNGGYRIDQGTNPYTAPPSAGTRTSDFFNN